MKNPMTKTVLASAAAVFLFGAGVVAGANQFGKPSSIIHVVHVKWKADATDAQKKAALDGVEKMAAEIPGIKNIWLKQVRKQPGDAFHDAAYVIEFQDRAAEKVYEKHPARTAWYDKVYNPIREESTSNQYTN
jgi:hypothetical protein